MEDTGQFDVTFTISLEGERSPYQVTESFIWDNQNQADDAFNSNGTTSEQMNQQLLPIIRKIIPEKIVILHGWRQLSDEVQAHKNYVDFLDNLRRSSVAAQFYYELYEKMMGFFQDLTGMNVREIYPRGEITDLNILVDKVMLPLSQYGDGIRHLLMLATNAALNPGGIFIIEEPETHLHPHFQRRLLWFLAEKIKSQVFISTHSPIFLDSQRADHILKVTHDISSKIEIVTTLNDCYSVLDDIGARPSDILQANVVIWVEGPSDRILIKKGLSIIASDLLEGLHYQIVFYGGALRKYCSFGENSNSLVDLMRLSRHVAMLCDRDGDTADDSISKEKQRLRDQCNEVRGFYWVTQGREIENYLPDSVLSRAFRELINIPPDSVRLSDNQRLGDALTALSRRMQLKQNKWLQYAKHKPETMSRIVRHITEAEDLKRLDFLLQLQKLAQFIRKHNIFNTSIS